MGRSAAQPGPERDLRHRCATVCRQRPAEPVPNTDGYGRSAQPGLLGEPDGEHSGVGLAGKRAQGEAERDSPRCRTSGVERHAKAADRAAGRGVFRGPGGARSTGVAGRERGYRCREPAADQAALTRTARPPCWKWWTRKRLRERGKRARGWPCALRDCARRAATITGTM